MRIIKHILSSSYFYIFFIINFSLVSFTNIALFSKPVAQLTQAITVLNNTDTNHLSFDIFPEVQDVFLNFKNTQFIKLNNDSPETINANIYQFIENTTYTSSSIINEKNLVNGHFKNLQLNEIAISQKTMETFNLEIGDKLIISNGTEVKIVFSFLEPYQISTFDFSNKKTSVFLGEKTLNDSLKVNYLNFKLTDRLHNEIYSLKEIKSQLEAKVFVQYLLLGIITILLNVFLFSLREKIMFLTFSETRLSGANFFGKVLITEGMYTLAVAASLSVLFFLFHLSLIHFLLIVFMYLILYIAHVFKITIKVRSLYYDL